MMCGTLIRRQCDMKSPEAEPGNITVGTALQKGKCGIGTEKPLFENCGLPDGLKNMLKRFWRGDLSRTDVRYSGLGLSVVQALADVLDIYKG